jgi:hypothetical protein
MKPAIVDQPAISSDTASPPNELGTAAARRVALTTEDTAAAETSAPLWEPTPLAHKGIPTSSDVLNATVPKGTLSAIVEHELIAIITRPLAGNETHQTGNDNRERELRSYLGSLSPLEALALRKRLDIDRSDDRVAVAFRRLLAERRHRLTAFLADPRRRRG